MSNKTEVTEGRMTIEQYEKHCQNVTVKANAINIREAEAGVKFANIELEKTRLEKDKIDARIAHGVFLKDDEEKKLAAAKEKAIADTLADKDK